MNQLRLGLPPDRPPLVFIAMSFDGKPLSANPVEEGENWHPAAMWSWLSYHNDRYERDPAYRVQWDADAAKAEARIARLET